MKFPNWRVILFTSEVKMNVYARLPHIYDAATSERHWEVALDHVSSAAGAIAATLYAGDSLEGNYTFQSGSKHFRNREREMAVYLENFSQYDVQAFDHCFGRKPFEFIKDEEIWPGYLSMPTRPDLEFCRENFGIGRRAAFNISNADFTNALVAIHFDKKIVEFEPEKTKDSSMLAFHLGKALEINRFYQQLRSRYNAVLAVLDHVNVGICLGLRSGEVIVQNATARKIFDDDDGLTLNRYGKIQFSEADHSSQLSYYIDECSKTAVGEQNVSERVILAKRITHLEPYILEVSPLRDGLNEIGDAFAGAMLLIIDPAHPPKIPLHGVSKLYSLTKAEIEVVELLLEGKSLNDISDIRGVTLNTAKNQCKMVYGKIGVANRAQLVRKIVAISPPID